MLEKGFGLEPYNTVFQSENSGITANKEAENEYYNAPRFLDS